MTKFVFYWITFGELGIKHVKLFDELIDCFTVKKFFGKEQKLWKCSATELAINYTQMSE